jgi:hypothetical protein
MCCLILIHCDTAEDYGLVTSTRWNCHVLTKGLSPYFKWWIEKGDDKKGWTKVRCVLTLDEEEIRRGVDAGEPYLHHIRDSFKFRFWDGNDDFLHLKKDPKGKPTAWEIPEFQKQRPVDV